MKSRHIKKAIKCIRTKNFNHLFGNKKLIQFVWPIQCNLNCRMCHQKDIRKQGEHILNLDQIDKMLDNLKREGVTQVNLIGGELFIFKEKAFKIIDMLNQKNILYSIATNATLLNETDINELSKGKGLLEFDISLDGFEKEHDYIRGYRGLFKKTVDIIKQIKSYGIPVMVVSVAQNNNIRILPEFTRFIKSLNVDSYTIVQEYSLTEDDLDKSYKLLKAFSLKPVTIFASSSVFPHTFKYEYELFKSKINQCKDIAKEINLELNTSFELERDDKNIFEFIYDKTVRKLNYVSCNALNCGQIDWQGNKNICPFIRISDLRCGKSYEDKFKLEDDETKQIIKEIKANNLLPMCDRCCALQVVRGK
jgi:MoaA/NifB/PqqE/SkfB family radical SAM enzyme